MDIVVWKDDRCETVVKENDGDEWSSDDVVLLLARR
jgi:hypothetical protein